MENMDLSNAEVAVTTQHILDGKEYKDYWVQMSDYSDTLDLRSKQEMR